MAYYDTYNNVQFLDLSGVDEEEKKWILTSLQGSYPCVEGPWSKEEGIIENIPSSQQEYAAQANLNNGVASMSYEQYPSPPVIISNHVSPISTRVYPQTYPATIPLYPQAFVPQMQYAAPIVPVVPATMVPVNAPIMSYAGPPVTYATYQTPIQANAMYNMPVVKDATKVNPNSQYHCSRNDQQQEYCRQIQYPPQPHHAPVSVQQHQPHPYSMLPQVQPSTSTNMQPPDSNNSNTNACGAKVVMQTTPQPPVSSEQPVAQVQQTSNQVSNGPIMNSSPVDINDVSANKKVSSAPVGQNVPTVVNGHEVAAGTVQTNGIGSGAVPPIGADTSSTNAENQSGSVSLNSDPVNAVTTVSNGSTTSAVGGGSGGMSWASLFNKTNTAETTDRQESITLTNNTAAKSPLQSNKVVSSTASENNRKPSPLAAIGDPNYYRMGEVLVNYMPDNKITSLQPRGLINRSNYCYINSILQALLACPPMYNLLHALGQNVTSEYRKHTHIIDNVVKFVKEFNLLPAAQRVNRRSDKVQKKEQNVVVTYDRPFEPNWIYKMLNGMQSDSFVVEGRQEDAEEFLGCLLNGLNDEMLELMKLVGAEIKPAESVMEEGYKSDSEREWQVIGPKNKGSITRRTEIVRTPISDIFGGRIRSKLHRTGDQDTNNIQPFFTLQLNIEKVNTVRDALEALVSKNQLEGVTSSKTNEEVEAWQQVTIEELPVVLILHLKCFDFKMDGCTKIVKALEFPVDLKIDTKLLSQKNNYQPKEKQYKLFAVVYHDGKEATKGHYLTDAYHVGYATWLRFDDSTVKTVQEEQVLKPHGTRVPYLLFYRRCDTVRNK